MWNYYRDRVERERLCILGSGDMRCVRSACWWLKELSCVIQLAHATEVELDIQEVIRVSRPMETSFPDILVAGE
jgi:hypothetical protein